MAAQSGPVVLIILCYSCKNVGPPDGGSMIVVVTKASDKTRMSARVCLPCISHPIYSVFVF